MDTACGCPRWSCPEIFISLAQRQRARCYSGVTILGSGEHRASSGHQERAQWGFFRSQFNLLELMNGRCCLPVSKPSATAAAASCHNAVIPAAREPRHGRREQAQLAQAVWEGDGARASGIRHSCRHLTAPVPQSPAAYSWLPGAP